MTENDLIEKLNKDLEQVNQDLLKISNSKKVYNNYIEICNNILNASDDVIDLHSFAQMDLDKVFDEIGYSNDVLSKMKIYQKLSMSSNYPIREDQKHDIASMFKDINKFLVHHLANCTEKENELKNKALSFENVINKLSSNTTDRDCYEFLYQYFLNDKDLEKNFDLFIALSLRFNDSIDFDENLIEDDETIEEIEITNLELNKVKQIFSKYDYDFLNFSDEIAKGITPVIGDEKVSPREYVLKLGKYDNIEEILKVLNDNDVKLDLNKYSNQLCLIFVLSNAKNVDNIINNIKYDIKENANYSFDELFKEFIKRPSFFITGNKHWGGRPIVNHPPQGDSSIISGVFYNYIKNRELFSSLGIDIVSSFIKCSTAFENSHKTVKKNIEILEAYGVNKEQYAKSLSCLGYDSYKIAFAFDRFIETGNTGRIQQGGYEYIKHNLSRISMKEQDLKDMIYRIINAANNGDTMEMLFNVTGAGNKKMALINQRLINYPNDAIYINGKKQTIMNINPRDLAILKLDFEDMTIPFHKNLYENDFVKKLEKYKEDDLYYNLNGVIISRNKVLRNINILLKNNKLNDSSFMYAITKDTILTNLQCGSLMLRLWKLTQSNTSSVNGGYRR